MIGWFKRRAKQIVCLPCTSPFRGGISAAVDKPQNFKIVKIEDLGYSMAWSGALAMMQEVTYECLHCQRQFKGPPSYYPGATISIEEFRKIENPRMYR